MRCTVILSAETSKTIGRQWQLLLDSGLFYGKNVLQVSAFL